MKKLFLVLVLGITAGWLICGTAGAQTPSLKVGLAMKDSRLVSTSNRLVYLLDDPTTTGVEDPDPLVMEITLENTGGDIITKDGFSKKPFHLMMTFLDPEGRGVTAIGLTTQSEPDPPRVIPAADGSLLQVDPVEILPGGTDSEGTGRWVWIVTIPNAHELYHLSKAGHYSVKVSIPMRTYPAVDHVINNTSYAEIDQVNWAGVVESNSVHFSLVADRDGDGYFYPEPSPLGGNVLPDCDDNNPLVHPGALEIVDNGIDDDCDPLTADLAAVPKGTILLLAEKHTVGTGSYPGSTKVPITPPLPVMVYDKSPYSCASYIGVSWQHYKTIWEYCAPVDGGTGTTGADGTLSLNVPPGNYLLVGHYDPDSNTAGDDIYIGNSVGTVEADQTVQKYLQVIVKANNKYVPAKYTKKTGSELLIIEPEYVEWTDTQELYPFIFQSLGDWSVTTAVTPPEGFVADHDYLATEVNTDLRSVQFTITDVGSEWVDTLVEHRLNHKGKTEIVKTRIGVKKNLEKKKGGKKK